MTSTSAERWKSSDVERHGLGGLRQQRAGDAGHDRGDGVDLADMRAARRADRRHADARFSRMPRKRQAERRIDQPPRHQERQEQHDQRIAVGGVAVEIELEQCRAAATCARPAGRRRRRSASSRCWRPRAAASPKPERDHDQREMPEARDDEAREHSRAGRPRAPAITSPVSGSPQPHLEMRPAV